MKQRIATLPLGIDIGHRRVRIALTVCERDATPRLIAVAGRDHDGDVTHALGEALADLQTDERRCVVALSAADAMLRLFHFPPMPRWERLRAARFEAARSIDYPLEDAAISLVPTSSAERWIAGIARRSAIAAAVNVVRPHRLRAIAIDDAALAMHRAHPAAGGAIDVGAESTRVAIFTADVPAVTHIAIGGDQLTDAISRSLGIDRAAAERRKCSTGFGGAGDAARDLLVASIADAVIDGHTQTGGAAARIALCGNGARIPGFDRAIANATGAEVVLAELPAQISDVVPADILRVAGADWSVAYGLSLWSCAA
jgi:Tfp pilus assembly PilM family ATPase